MLPRNLRSLLHRARPAIGIDPLLVEASDCDPASALRRLESCAEGLSEAEAALRLARDGPNAVARAERFVRLRLLARACSNPLVVLLALLMILELTTGDTRAATVMGLMILLGVSLRFVQEARASDAAAKLRAMIRVTATVLRDGKPREVPLGELVAGDVVALAAGDIVPADVRLLACRDLHVGAVDAHRGVAPGREGARARPGPGAAAARRPEPLLPRHERRERHGPRAGGRDRSAHLLRHHGGAPRASPSQRPRSTAASRTSPG